MSRAETIRGLERGLQVLQVLQSKPIASLKELHAATGISKPSLLRILTTLEAKTGVLLKQGRLRDAVDQYYASPVGGDGKVYFASRTGIVTVLRAGGEQEVLSVADLEEEVSATPALADGRVYLRTKSALYCFGMAVTGSKAK